MKKIFVCTALSDGVIVGVERVFDDESIAARFCNKMNSSRHGLFFSYTYG